MIAELEKLGRDVSIAHSTTQKTPTPVVVTNVVQDRKIQKAPPVREQSLRRISPEFW
jgi:hypothetical protein